MLKSLVLKYRDQILYLIFGVLTTIVDYVIYYYMCKWSVIPSGIRATVSNGIAWFAAVLFAYITNKPFVFGSKDWSAKTVIFEFGKFSSCRLVSGIFASLMIFVFVDVLSFNNVIIKLLSSVFVVIFNYFASKWFVFINKNY